MQPLQPRQQHKRHTRRYAEGDLGESSGFYFHGPDGKLNLRTQNPMLFAQIAQGVDTATWDHHRRQREHSGWFRETIKDEDLAREAAMAESDESLDSNESRRRIVDAIHQRYTAPARAPQVSG